MSDLAGSKRPASTPFASPSKAASKRSRTKYDYGDEDDTESSPEDQWSADDADSMSWDGEDDDFRSFMPSPSADFMSLSSDDDGDAKGHNTYFRKRLTFPEVGRPIELSSSRSLCLIKVNSCPRTHRISRRGPKHVVHVMLQVLLKHLVPTVRAVKGVMPVIQKSAAVVEVRHAIIPSAKLTCHQYLARARSTFANAS